MSRLRWFTRALLTAALGTLLLYSSGAVDPVFGDSEVFLGITRSEGERVPISVVRIESEALTPTEVATIRSVLEGDLKRSLFFRVVRPPMLPELTAVSTPSADLLKRIGAEGIDGSAWLKAYKRGRDVVLEARVFDSASGQLVLGKRYIGDPDILRTVVHRLSDEVVLRYTGEKGVAQTRIVYFSNLTGNKELYLMDYDGFNPRRLTNDRSINLSPRWSPDAKWVTYTSYLDGNPNIYTLDLESGRRWRVIGFTGLNISPAWSPSGDRLAFASSKDGPSQIYIAAREGNALTKVTTDTGDSLSPSWSPTGSEMAFTSNRGGTPQIYIMAADGTNIRRLTFLGEYNTSAAWSPKGDWIAFSCQVEGRQRICVIRPDGSKTLQLTDGPGDDEAASWSPDGKHLAFRSTRSSSGDIYMMNVDGTGVERLTFNGMQNSGPAWSPNS